MSHGGICHGGRTQRPRLARTEPGGEERALAEKTGYQVVTRDDLAFHAAAEEAARYHLSQTVSLGPWDRLLAFFGLISKDAHWASLVRVVLDKNAKIAEVRRSVAPPESSGWTNRDWGEA